ncbi:phosphate propanoyltransferase [Dehalobacterium formicoaceticum]|uniref:Phosphate propanoyltransferase n=2 Tax=Dehalobacterium formicoaceticum TaxID=51515 RepID=A0ABT1Y2W9_9FIRM|nr:phosphate propanoyltransferase [Dehalobacterium formicoaceticum]
MRLDKGQLEEIVKMVLRQQLSKECCDQPLMKEDKKIPIGISNRHVHLSGHDLEILFGGNATLTRFKDLSQPGQFACAEKVTLVGPKGVIENVRILGPTRNRTQVEISVSDCFKLGVKAPIRDSGDLSGSAGLTLVGPAGSVTVPEGCIIAARHIHMHPKEAARFNVKDGERINVQTEGARGVVFCEVMVRVSEEYNLEMHVDMDEANAASLKNGDFVKIID